MRAAFVGLLLVAVASACRRDDRARADAAEAGARPAVAPTGADAGPREPPGGPEASASASAPASASPAPLPAADAGVDVVGERPRLSAWARARIATAATRAELVRIPITRHGPGWGCICPEVFIGVNGGADENTIWLEPTFAETATPLAPGTAVVAEGYFTGKSTRFAPQTTEVYEQQVLHGFHVLRHRPVAFDPNSEGPAPVAADAQASIVLTAAEAHHEAPAPADGRGVLLVAASLPMHEKDARAVAEKRRDELRTKGFPEAEVLDSRTAPGLFCCHWVVVVSRHRTAAEAGADAARAKANKIDTLVRRGW